MKPTRCLIFPFPYPPQQPLSLTVSPLHSSEGISKPTSERVWSEGVRLKMLKTFIQSYGQTRHGSFTSGSLIAMPVDVHTYHTEREKKRERTTQNMYVQLRSILKHKLVHFENPTVRLESTKCENERHICSPFRPPLIYPCQQPPVSPLE